MIVWCEAHKNGTGLNISKRLPSLQNESQSVVSQIEWPWFENGIGKGDCSYSVQYEWDDGKG